MLPRRRANKSQVVALRGFSHWPRRIGLPRGGGQGVSRARCGLKHDPGEGDGESWKSRGGRVRLYTWRRVGPAMLDAAGGEGGHRVAKANRVIHRYVYQ